MTGQGGFCKLEDVRDQGLGYDFLVRFFVGADRRLAVTMRAAEVEQISFCTSEAAAAITFRPTSATRSARVRRALPRQVAELSGRFGQIIR